MVNFLKGVFLNVRVYRVVVVVHYKHCTSDVTKPLRGKQNHFTL